MMSIGRRGTACWLSLIWCVACAPGPQAKRDPATESLANAPEAPLAAPPAPSEPPKPAPELPSTPPPKPIEQAPATAPADRAPQPSAAKTTQPPAGAKVRTIHPLGDSDTKDCIEMYGMCTPPPERLCTSSAFILSCGETGQLPSGKREWLRCTCP